MISCHELYNNIYFMPHNVILNFRKHGIRILDCSLALFTIEQSGLFTNTFVISRTRGEQMVDFRKMLQW